MSTVKDVFSFLDSIAPFSFAAPWDNTGLLVGDFSKEVKKVMLSLDVTGDVIDEAIKEAVDALSDNLTAKIDAEIERSTAADDYISGLTAEFSAATVAEFILVNSAVTVETERAMAAELYLSGAVETETARALEAELFLSGAVDTERAERIAEDDAIKA